MTAHAVRITLLAALIVAATAACELVWSAHAAQAGTLVMSSCSAFGDSAADIDADGLVWVGTSNGVFATADDCRQGRSLRILTTARPRSGDSAQWVTTTPPGVEITHAWAPAHEVLIDSDSGDGFDARFFWNGGSQRIYREKSCCGGMDYGSGIDRSLGPSRRFGWKVVCARGPCGEPFDVLDVRGIELEAVDDTRPALLALGSNNIWYQSARWIRGDGWPASFQASDSDGVCAMGEAVNGSTAQTWRDASPNRHSWTQCPTPQTLAMTINTTQYPNGPLVIALAAGDAASPANVSIASTVVHVDNSPVELSLSGPADAPATAGTQYVSASASAGPSSVAAIYCSVDGGPYIRHPGASAEIPVSGVGLHHIACVATNNAIDPAGEPAVSPVETFQMMIRVPTEAAISFTRIADRLRCHKSRVSVPGKPRVVKRHGKWVVLPGRRHVEKVTRCHARTAIRKVIVVIHRHGKAIEVKRRARVVLEPHVIYRQRLRVPFGHGATLSGVLLAEGSPLAGRDVEIYAAPNNQLGRFALAASATTSSNGTWSARVPAGPSRLIEAAYAGDQTTEPVISGAITLTVPAKIRVHVSPRVLPWSGTLTISGQLLGGYVPPDGVALRLLVHYPGNRRPSPLLALRTNSAGAFEIRWSYRAGHGVATYPMAISTTASESDYPFAASTSRWIRVTFGRATPAARHHIRKRRHRRRRR